MVYLHSLSHEKMNKICVLVLWLCVGVVRLERSRLKMVMIPLQFSPLVALLGPFCTALSLGLGDLKAYLRRAVKTSFHLFNYSGD